MKLVFNIKAKGGVINLFNYPLTKWFITLYSGIIFLNFKCNIPKRKVNGLSASFTLFPYNGKLNVSVNKVCVYYGYWKILKKSWFFIVVLRKEWLLNKQSLASDAFTLHSDILNTNIIREIKILIILTGCKLTWIPIQVNNQYNTSIFTSYLVLQLMIYQIIISHQYFFLFWKSVQLPRSKWKLFRDCTYFFFLTVLDVSFEYYFVLLASCIYTYIFSLQWLISPLPVIYVQWGRVWALENLAVM